VRTRLAPEGLVFVESELWRARTVGRAVEPGEDVRVLALRYPYRAGRYGVCGAEVTALGGAQSAGWPSARLWGRTLRSLHAEHRRRPFDVLHALWAGETGALAAVAGRLLGVRSVVSLAGGELVGLPDIGYGGQLVRTERLKLRLATRLADEVTAGSHSLRTVAESKLHRPVRWAPLGVDTELFTPGEARETEPPRLVQAASLVPIKDQATLVRAAARLHERGRRFRLEVLGEGPLRGGLEELARRLNVDSCVRFRGAVRHEALPEAYRGAAAFVLSSRHEAQSMAVLEAAACGVSTVGTAVGLVPELAEAGAARAVPTHDPEALAGALDDLLGSAERRRALGLAARAQAAVEFSLAACVDRFRALYSRP
jgi:glycosyltransferase involved in cell wall biosynthesis